MKELSHILKLRGFDTWFWLTAVVWDYLSNMYMLGGLSAAYLFILPIYRDKANYLAITSIAQILKKICCHVVGCEKNAFETAGARDFFFFVFFFFSCFYPEIFSRKIRQRVSQIISRKYGKLVIKWFTPDSGARRENVFARKGETATKRMGSQ